jgi:hypothetical protein
VIKPSNPQPNKIGSLIITNQILEAKGEKNIFLKDKK